MSLLLAEYYEVVACASCSMSFAITKTFYKQKRNDHNSFYCPNGHNNYYPAKSDVEKLEEQLTIKDKIIEQVSDSKEYYRNKAEELKRSRAAYKAHLTITKNKIKDGKI